MYVSQTKSRTKRTVTAFFCLTVSCCCRRRRRCNPYENGLPNWYSTKKKHQEQRRSSSRSSIIILCFGSVNTVVINVKPDNYQMLKTPPPVRSSLSPNKKQASKKAEAEESFTAKVLQLLWGGGRVLTVRNIYTPDRFVYWVDENVDLTDGLGQRREGYRSTAIVGCCDVDG